MGDGQEVSEEFPRKMNQLVEERHGQKKQHAAIVQTLCWGCGAMIEEVDEGEDNWLFCPCGTGIMKVTI